MFVGEAHVARIASLDSRQSLNAAREVIVGIGPIHHPPASSRRIARRSRKAAVELRQVGILDADKMEFGLSGKRRTRTFFVVLKSRSLRQERDGEQKKDRGAGA